MIIAHERKYVDCDVTALLQSCCKMEVGVMSDLVVYESKL